MMTVVSDTMYWCLIAFHWLGRTDSGMISEMSHERLLQTAKRAFRIRVAVLVGLAVVHLFSGGTYLLYQVQ